MVGGRPEPDLCLLTSEVMVTLTEHFLCSRHRPDRRCVCEPVSPSQRFREAGPVTPLLLAVEELTPRELTTSQTSLFTLPDLLLSCPPIIPVFLRLE